MLLTKIDQILRRDHRFLDESDDCYFIGEFTARRGFNFSETNKKIYDLKIYPTKARANNFFYNLKVEAMRYWARKLAEALPVESLAGCTIVPVPCSKRSDHDEHDDRLAGVLRMAYKDQIDVRKIMRSRVNRDAAHSLDTRATPATLQEALEVDEQVSAADVKRIVIFDDVVTRGASFKAMKASLLAKAPGVVVQGVFLARTVHIQDAVDFDEIPV